MELEGTCHPKSLYQLQWMRNLEKKNFDGTQLGRILDDRHSDRQRKRIGLVKTLFFYGFPRFIKPEIKTVTLSFNFFELKTRLKIILNIEHIEFIFIIILKIKSNGI